jgi:hypothetical protein
MSPGTARWKVIVSTWIGVMFGCLAAIAVVVLFLEEGHTPAIVATVFLGIVAGILITRRQAARDRKTIITVEDLRRR